MDARFLLFHKLKTNSSEFNEIENRFAQFFKDFTVFLEKQSQETGNVRKTSNKAGSYKNFLIRRIYGYEKIFREKIRNIETKDSYNKLNKINELDGFKLFNRKTSNFYSASFNAYANYIHRPEEDENGKKISEDDLEKLKTLQSNSVLKNLNLKISHEQDEKIVPFLLSKFLYDISNKKNVVQEIIDNTIWLLFFGLSINDIEKLKNNNMYLAITEVVKKRKNSNIINQAIEQYKKWLEAEESFEFKQVLFLILIYEKEYIDFYEIENLSNSNFRARNFISLKISEKDIYSMLKNLNDLNYISVSQSNRITYGPKLKYSSLFLNKSVSPPILVELKNILNELVISQKQIEEIFRSIGLSTEKGNQIIEKLDIEIKYSHSDLDNMLQTPNTQVTDRDNIEETSNELHYSTEQRKLVKSILTDSIKNVEEAISILNENGISDFEKILDEIHMYIKDGYIIDKKFETLSEAVRANLLQRERFALTLSSIDQSATMKRTVNQMERDLEVFSIAEYVYVSKIFLESRDIHKNKIDRFIEEVSEFLKDEKYFSIIFLKNADFTNELFNLGFEDIFYERILMYSDKFTSMTRSSPQLLTRRVTPALLLEEFFVDEYNSVKESIDLEDFLSNIKNKYGIKFTTIDSVSRLEEYGVFYSSTMKRLYNSKQIYLKEVYGNDN